MIIQYKQFGSNEWKEVEVGMFKYNSNDFSLVAMASDCSNFINVDGVSDVSVKHYKYNFNKDGGN